MGNHTSHKEGEHPDASQLSMVAEAGKLLGGSFFASEEKRTCIYSLKINNCRLALLFTSGI